MHIATDIVFKPSDGFQSTVPIADLMAGSAVAHDGTLLWGPYVEVPSGHWTVTFTGEFESTAAGASCDVAAEQGIFILGGAPLAVGAGTLAEITFHSHFKMVGVEFRVFAAAGSRIRIDEITLRRVEHDVGGGAVSALDNAGRRFDIYQRDGFSLVLDPASLVDHHVINNGCWEPEQLRFLKMLTSRIPRTARTAFLDIGSYFGLYSLHMVRSRYFDEVVAFEADKLNYRQLQANLLLNDPGLIVAAHNFAASAENGEAFFYPSWEHPTQNRGGVGLLPSGQSTDVCVSVPTRALDRVLALAGYIIFAKLDVEGAELDVLRGMRRTLQSNRCVLQIEALNYKREDAERIEQIDVMLTALGYRMIHAIEPDKYYSNVPETWGVSAA